MCVCVLQSMALRPDGAGAVEAPCAQVFPERLQRSKGHPEMGPGAKKQVVSWAVSWKRGKSELQATDQGLRLSPESSGNRG